MLKVGASKVCINPTADMYPFPSKNGDWGVKGYAPSAIYDDMHCRAIAIDNGIKSVLFISYELGGVPDIPELIPAISRETGIPAEDIIITATHNHTCVRIHTMSKNNPAEKAFIEKYYAILLDRSVQMAVDAVRSMRQAKYGYGEIDSYINTNRDLETPFGFWVEARNLAGYSDKTLAIVKFVDEDGKLIAALLNHGTHNTCCYLMRDADGLYKTSGNFSGISCRFAEEHFGDGAVVLWTSGAAGNQNPLLSHGLQYEYPDGYSTTVSYPDGVGHMQMELMGRTHGADAVKGIDGITMYSANMPIVHCRKNIMLPTQKGKDHKGDGPIIIRAAGNGLRGEGDVPVMPTFPEMIDDVDNPAELKMQVLMLGDIAVVLANAELYAQIGRDMKAASPYKKTFVVTHSDKSIGYILDKSSVNEKVFQAFTRVKPGSADELIIDCQTELFDCVLSESMQR